MQVRMKTVARGPDFAADPGDEKTVDDTFGQGLIDAGSAELIEDVQVEGAAPAVRRERATAARRTKR